MLDVVGDGGGVGTTTGTTEVDTTTEAKLDGTAGTELERTISVEAALCWLETRGVVGVGSGIVSCGYESRLGFGLTPGEVGEATVPVAALEPEPVTESETGPEDGPKPVAVLDADAGLKAGEEPGLPLVELGPVAVPGAAVEGL